MPHAPILLAAHNPSEWTGPTGNNTWLLRGKVPALIDAGTGDPEHVASVERALDGAQLSVIFVTHRHQDHVAGIPALRARWSNLRVIDLPIDPQPAGDTVLHIVATPGHSPDHLCFFDVGSRDLYCGDLARAGGSIVIPARKGGNLREYLASLERVRELRPRRLLPGHGPIVDDPIALIDQYIAHRAERERQILEAMAGGARTPEEIVARVYEGLSEALQRAAVETVEAHLQKLRDERRM